VFGVHHPTRPTVDVLHHDGGPLVGVEQPGQVAVQRFGKAAVVGGEEHRVRGQPADVLAALAAGYDVEQVWADVGPWAQREILDRLLELNHERYAAEVAKGLHDKKPRAAAKNAPKTKPAAEGLF
jgi:hypothetical protein